MKIKEVDLKTYCKPATVNIEDWKFNEIAVVECFRNKRARKTFNVCSAKPERSQSVSLRKID